MSPGLSGDLHLPDQPKLADTFFQGHVSAHHAVGGLKRWVAFNGPKELPRSQQVADTVCIFFVGFPGPVLHGVAMVAHRLAVDQADPIATAVEPFVQGLPGDTGGLHSDQETLTPVFDQMVLEGLFKAPETFSGVGKLKLATAHGGLRPQTRIVFGFAHIDSNKEQMGLVYIRFTLVGISSILCQSHGTYLLL
jgi:hypothetical protein